MATVINDIKVKKRAVYENVLSGALPYKLFDEIRRVSDKYGRLEELRCRSGRRAYVSIGGRNIMLSYVVSVSDMNMMTDAICGGSLYAHSETMAEGFITLEGGVRVGICGRAVVEGGKIIGIYDVSGLNYRIPSPLLKVGASVCRLLNEGGCNGVLIYSPPGVGKTTLLRGIAAGMSSGSGARRVAVIDTRGELGSALTGEELSLDILVGYPRGKGIEIATRTLNPELIICDEIGDLSEAQSIVTAANSGVPVVATAHADSVDALLKRDGFDRLHRAAVFGYYVGIRRNTDKTEYEYDIKRREEVEC